MDWQHWPAPKRFPVGVNRPERSDSSNIQDHETRQSTTSVDNLGACPLTVTESTGVGREQSPIWLLLRPLSWWPRLRTATGVPGYSS